VRCSTIALLGHKYLKYWSTLNAFLSDNGKLFADKHMLLYTILWFSQQHYLRQGTHPLTFLLENYDANLLRNHGLHWQQSRNWILALQDFKHLRQLYVLQIAFLFLLLLFL